MLLVRSAIPAGHPGQRINQNFKNAKETLYMLGRIREKNIYIYH